MGGCNCCRCESMSNGGAALQVALERGVPSAGGIRANAAAASHSTAITIVAAGEMSADGIGDAFAIAASGALGTAIQSSSTPIINAPSPAAEVGGGANSEDSGGPAPPAPLCLTCMDASSAGSGIEGWTVAVIVGCLCATCVFVMAIAAYVKLKGGAGGA